MKPLAEKYCLHVYDKETKHGQTCKQQGMLNHLHNELVV